MVVNKASKVFSIFVSVMLMVAIVFAFSACGDAEEEYKMQFEKVGTTGDGYVYAQVLTFNMTDDKDLTFNCEDFTVNGTEIKGVNFVTGTHISSITGSSGSSSTTVSSFGKTFTIEKDKGNHLQIVFDVDESSIETVYYKGQKISTELQ